MDALYKVYAKIRLDQLTNLTTYSEDSYSELNPKNNILENRDNILYFSIEKIPDLNGDENEDSVDKMKNRVISVGEFAGATIKI